MNLPALQRKCLQRRTAVEPHFPTLNAPTCRELRTDRVVEVLCLRRISRKTFRIILMKQAVNYIGAAPHRTFSFFPSFLSFVSVYFLQTCLAHSAQHLLFNLARQ